MFNYVKREGIIPSLFIIMIKTTIRLKSKHLIIMLKIEPTQ